MAQGASPTALKQLRSRMAALTGKQRAGGCATVAIRLGPGKKATLCSLRGAKWPGHGCTSSLLSCASGLRSKPPGPSASRSCVLQYTRGARSE
eukprot:7794606-Pyramimonas_sp.AAC.1